jgi:hypothetical protein
LFCFVLLLDDTILTRVKWNLSVIFICVSFTVEDVEHFFFFFFFFFAFGTSSFGKCLSSLANLLIGLFVVLVFDF